MFHDVFTGRVLAILGLSILLAVAGGAAFFSFVFPFAATAQSTVATPTNWPSLRMVYELEDGDVLNGQTVNEVHQLVYRSASDWIDTVTASDRIESLALGTISTIGSYKRMSGTRYEEYDSITDEVTVEKVESDTIVVPNAFLVPLNVAELRKGSLSQASTVARLCYSRRCEDDASGLSFTSPRGVEWVVTDDSRWAITLKVGDAFLVRELGIDAAPATTE